MRIYTRLVFDSDFNLIEEEFYENDGPVAECKGGSNEIKETSEERELAEISAEQWNRYQDVFRPLEDQHIAGLDATDQDYGTARGEAAGASRREFGKAKESVRKSGARPGSGRYGITMADLAEDEAASAAGGATKAHLGVRDRQDFGKLQMVQLGRGQEADAMEGFSEQAYSEASRAAADAKNAERKHSSQSAAVGTAAGMGVRGWQGGSSNTGSLDGNDYYGENLPKDNINAGTWNNPNF